MRFLATAAALCSALAAQNGSVYLSANGAWSFTPGVVDQQNAVAWASYVDWTETKSAFGSLTVTTNAKYNDSTQMFGAGFAEAALTQARIYDQYINIHAWISNNFNNNTIPPIYQQFFDEQNAWSRQQVATNTSQLWQAMGGILSQFDGLVAGYAATASPNQSLDVWAFQQLNAIGDFLDLIPALQPSSDEAQRWDWRTYTDPEDIMRFVHKTTHCSGLIKVDGNFSDIYAAHSAWFTFTGTSRIYKHYQFALHNTAVMGQQVSFSSYPGYLSSLDDFYQVWDTGLVIIETTNSIFNTTLYSLIVPQTLFAWQRVRLANHLAVDGATWGAIFSYSNSGTYNNAYSVLKVKGWSPGQPLPDGMLYLAEQIPGLVVYGDVTQELERGYFPQYNVPYWPQIYSMSGYPEVFAAWGGEHRDSALAGISYQLAPRAQIFRRDQGKVVDMDSFTALMRYNDYKNDPYAKGSPWNAICSRGDLSSSPSPDGCYDTKASSASMWSQKKSLAINGPTTNGGTLPPFSWTGTFASYSHVGLPQTYNYEFEEQMPAW